MNASILNFLYNIKDYIKENKKTFIYLFVVSVFGFLLGIYLSIVEIDFLDVLKEKDEILFDLIKGEASISNLFFNKLLDCLLIFVLIFIFNITFYTWIFNYFFVAYQSLLFGASLVALTSTYNLVGIFCVFLILPLNIISIVAITSMIVVLSNRAKFSHKHNVSFRDSFIYQKVFIKLVVCFSIFILAILLYSVVYGVLLKSFVFGIY